MKSFIHDAKENFYSNILFGVIHVRSELRIVGKIIRRVFFNSDFSNLYISSFIFPSN